MLLRGLLVVALSFGIAAPVSAHFFSDDFEDGIISSEWIRTGEISEAGGYLQLRRDAISDNIETAETFSGDWEINMDIRLNSIVWHDMFHGISIRDAAGAGVSIGYSIYGMIYQGTHDGTGGTGFDYGPANSNQVGDWINIKITRSSGMVSLLVNDSPVNGINAAAVPEAVTISLPGFYQDGDGSGGTGITSVDIDYFSISGTPTPTVPVTWGKVKSLYTEE